MSIDMGQAQQHPDSYREPSLRQAQNVVHKLL